MSANSTYSYSWSASFLHLSTIQLAKKEGGVTDEIIQQSSKSLKNAHTWNMFLCACLQMGAQFGAQSVIGREAFGFDQVAYSLVGAARITEVVLAAAARGFFVRKLVAQEDCKEQKMR